MNRGCLFMCAYPQQKLLQDSVLELGSKTGLKSYKMCISDVISECASDSA